jgi:mono/diheme cytochrome c family protein
MEKSLVLGSPLRDNTDMKATTILGLLLCLSACGQAEKGIRTADLEAGKKIYSLYCAACHQNNGTGVAENGVRMAANYTLEDGPLARSDEELLQIIQSGKTGNIGSMPAWRGILSAEKQRDVLAYLRASFAPPSEETN